MSCHLRDTLVPISARLRQTRRPRLLLRTARIGMAEYQRERDLNRLLRLPATPAPGVATVEALLDLEAEMEGLRTRPMSESGETWRAARHVEVLIALLAESRLLIEAVPASPEDLPRFVPLAAAPAA